MRFYHYAPLLAIVLTTLTACEAGYNKRFSNGEDTVEAPDCAQTASNPDLISKGVNLYNYLANLTCNEASKDGVLMGQNAGYGNQIASTNSTAPSYNNLFNAFGALKPAIVSIDYEYERVYTAEALNEANAKLKAHADAGGIVMISWMPLNPWINDGSDANGNPGNTDALAHNDDVDLASLVSEGNTLYTIWHNRLDAIADRLQYFEDNDIPILWRPLPSPNTDDYWWGLAASFDENDTNDASLYTNLWRDMYDYLTEEKELDNLLWVYSPAQSGDFPSYAPVDWALPDTDGQSYVDVVGAISESDELAIYDYKALSNLDKPLGMARFNQTPADAAGINTERNSFDTTAYADRLESSYKNVAFWVTWHSYGFGNDQTTYLALKDQLNFAALSERNYVLTLKYLSENNPF